MKVYVFKYDTLDTDAGTRLYFQQGMYFYKTRTEEERWLSREEVENNPELFRLQTAMEFKWGCFQTNA